MRKVRYIYGSEIYTFVGGSVLRRVRMFDDVFF